MFPKHEIILPFYIILPYILPLSIFSFLFNLVKVFFFKFFFLFIRHTACGILVPQPGIEPMLPPLGAQSLNHWTTRESLVKLFMCSYWNWICFAVFSLFDIYLLIWLGWVLLVVCGIFGCGAQTLIAVLGLSCPAANGIFPDQGSNLGSRERTLTF